MSGTKKRRSAAGSPEMSVYATPSARACLSRHHGQKKRGRSRAESEGTLTITNVTRSALISQAPTMTARLPGGTPAHASHFGLGRHRREPFMIRMLYLSRFSRAYGDKI
jgi:hypothetical protein